ncbi:MAG TPA: NepR family anti-sigma factor [Rhizomicrobium sp.]
MTNQNDNERDKNRTVRARQRALGRELRRMYDDVAREPVPDDFMDILQKLDKDGQS